MDGRSSSAEKTAAWTSREHGRSTRRWDTMKTPDTHTLSRHPDTLLHPLAIIHYETVQWAKHPVSKIHFCKWIMTNSVHFLAFEHVEHRDAGSADPRPFGALRPDVIPPAANCSPVVFCISNIVHGETIFAPKHLWHSVILPPFQQEIITYIWKQHICLVSMSWCLVFHLFVIKEKVYAYLH